MITEVLNQFVMEPIPYIRLFVLTTFIVINIISFLFMFIDKRKAIYHQWRIKESTLILLALFLGALGIIIGMIVFHHKTKKLKFVVGIPTILIIQFLLLCYWGL